MSEMVLTQTQKIAELAREPYRRQWGWGSGKERGIPFRGDPQQTSPQEHRTDDGLDSPT